MFFSSSTRERERDREMISVTYSMTTFVPRRRTTTVLITSNMKNTQVLRTEIQQLHLEAEKTRDKASNARLRLMRLSEAAMKLQQQAATDVRIGRENEARELLVQKRKVMQALEKSKSRIEMLDKLLAKLNEAITVKETQLVGNVSSGVEIGNEDASSNIHIISPKEDDEDILNEDQEKKLSDDTADHSLQFLGEAYNHADVDHLAEDVGDDTLSMEILKEAEFVNNLKDMSSYEEFLEHVDNQLNKIEVELITFLRFSTLVLENEEKSKNSKVQKAYEILQDVQGIRTRIGSITKTKAKMN